MRKHILGLTLILAVFSTVPAEAGPPPDSKPEISAAVSVQPSTLPAAHDAGATVAAPATPAAIVDPAVDPAGFARALFDAGRDGNYRLLIALGLVGAVYATRRWVVHQVAWLQTDRGGVLLTLGFGIAGSFATALVANGEVDSKFFLNGISLGVTAAGGFIVLKRLIWPKDAKPSEA